MPRKHLPFIEGLKAYTGKSLRADAIAGLTVALVLIPQSMAYAQLAGLPPYYGLYASLLPPIVATIFGSSRQLATGPVAIVSLMTAAALEPLAAAGTEAYIAYAVLLALFVGLFQLSLGLLRLGALVNFVSHPVVIGLTNAAALIIAVSQLPKLFGVTTEKGDHLFETVYLIGKAAYADTHLPTLLLGLSAFAVMVGLMRISRKIPYVLVAVAITTALSWGFGFEDVRSVSIAQIDSPEAHDTIEAYQHALRTASEMIEVRAAFAPEVDSIVAARPATCGSCHSNRKLDFFSDASGAAGGREQMDLEKERISIRALHAMAGLVDDRIEEVKRDAASLREKIRRFRFDAIERDGETRYRLTSEEKRPNAFSSKWRMTPPAVSVDPNDLEFSNGGRVVGRIPSGLPAFVPPRWDENVIWQMIISAVLISIIGFMEAVSIARAIAARTGQRLDPSQELIGQGLANIVGAFNQGYAVSGSFSRSAVNAQAGALTGISSLVTGGAVLLVLLFLTPLLYHLPQSVLAAIILMAVAALINVRGVVHAYRVKRSDGVISAVTFVATLAFSPHLDIGILIGAALSIAVFLYDKMKPSVADLSLWSDGHLHNASRLDLKLCKHIAVIRFDGPLFFANTGYLEDKVLDRVRTMPDIRAVLFKADGINEIDSSGEDMLSLLIDRLRAGGIDVYFSGLNEIVVDALSRSGLLKKIGEDHLFASVVQALRRIWSKLHTRSDEKDCPLKMVVRAETEVPPSAPRIRVLLVDDEVDFVEYTAKRLRMRGFDVDGAHDRSAAVAAVRKAHYDAVILDMKLRSDTGTEVLRELTEIRPGLSVVLLTGHAAVDTAVEAMRYGAADYLMKPCDIDILVQKIKDIHGRSNGPEAHR